MTALAFRRVALKMREATESAHNGHPDFRVGGKIFVTLFSREDREWGMVRLTPDQQERFVGANPSIFSPVRGAWGRQGCTQVDLRAVDRRSVATVRDAIFTAWCNAAPRRLVAKFDHPRQT